ncbi:synaptogyrin-3-like isoform X2 [Gouania willdenowi]|uniref:synaptogyrin-3-like isoform X2 n=1 Tax=Gouania willdenowi TaxID=441366 RepID=UPI001055DCD2|nr:synaptogyrin-3-like isoform X2 [Gouania willdenowi]
MEPAGAYGAGKAGSIAFDAVAFFTHPRTLLRLLSWVFSIVVFSCIINEGYINIGSERLLCIFNNNADACNYGITLGVACFLGSICFLILDVYFPTMSNVRDRRRAVMLDLIFSGVVSFLWFVGFCFLANQWQATSPDELPLAQGSDAARATIAFCFFSILTWVYRTDPQCTASLPNRQQHKPVHLAAPGNSSQQRPCDTVPHRQRGHHSDHQPLPSPALH